LIEPQYGAKLGEHTKSPGGPHGFATFLLEAHPKVTRLSVVSKMVKNPLLCKMLRDFGFTPALPANLPPELTAAIEAAQAAGDYGQVLKLVPEGPKSGITWGLEVGLKLAAAS
jgi:hypothetical protein